jgi:hypothetical protein
MYGVGFHTLEIELWQARRRGKPVALRDHQFAPAAGPGRLGLVCRRLVFSHTS